MTPTTVHVSPTSSVCHVDQTSSKVHVTPTRSVVRVRETPGRAPEALLEVSPFAMPGFVPQSAFTANHLIDASGEKVAAIFSAPKTGTIDRVCFASSTVTAGAILSISLQTVDSAGFPTGTQVGAGTIVGVFSANTYFESTLSVPAPVTAGQRLAIVVEWGSPANLNIAYVTPTVFSMRGAYSALQTGGVWVPNVGRFPVGAVRYTDGTYPHVPGMLAQISGFANTAYGSTSSPDERGNRFVPTVRCTVSGIYTNPTSFVPATDPAELVLYDSAGNVLANPALPGLDAANGHTVVYFPPVELVAGDVYRVTMKPTSANTLAIPDGPLDPTSKSATQGPWQFQKTTRTDAGVWTDTPNSIMGIGVVVSAIGPGESS